MLCEPMRPISGLQPRSASAPLAFEHLRPGAHSPITGFLAPDESKAHPGATWEDLEKLASSRPGAPSPIRCTPRVVSLCQAVERIDASQLVPIQCEVAPPCGATQNLRADDVASSDVTTSRRCKPPHRRSLDSKPTHFFSPPPKAPHLGTCKTGPLPLVGSILPFPHQNPQGWYPTSQHTSGAPPAFPGPSLTLSKSGPLQPCLPLCSPGTPPGTPQYPQGSMSGPMPQLNARPRHADVSSSASGPVPRILGTAHNSRSANKNLAAKLAAASPRCSPNPCVQPALCRAATWQGSDVTADERKPPQRATSKAEMANGSDNACPSKDFSSRQLLTSKSEGPKNLDEAGLDDGDSFIFTFPRKEGACQAGGNSPSADPGSAPSRPEAKFECDQSEMCKIFSVAELEAATNSWAPQNLLGKGSYGTVYKGSIAGAYVAVKKLHVDDWHSHKEYMTEVQVLSNIHHPNIVNLLGRCPEAHCLVFEYVPGGTLQDWLKEEAKRSALDWRTRLNVVNGLALALSALHESDPVVVHRDLKPENILLDSMKNTKLADVGLARLLATNGNCTYTVSGTAGFIDPEGMKTFEISPLADVYTFGLITLQLLMGECRVSGVHRVLDSLNLPNMQQPRKVHAAVAQLAKLADPSAGAWPSRVCLTLAMVALKCIQRDRSLRPCLASEVIPVLQELSSP